MQSKSRIHADHPLEHDHFDRIPDPLVLLILNRVADIRSLGRCSSVSKRFNSLVPLVHTIHLKIDRVLTLDSSNPSSPKPRTLLSHLLKLLLLSLLKPFHNPQPSPAAPAKPLLPQLSHHSPSQVLKNFAHVRHLFIELPAADVGTDDGVFLKWRAEFGSTLHHCLILGATKINRNPNPNSNPDDDDGTIPESFYTNGGLKLRVVWTISSLIAASTRHYLLKPIIEEHPTLRSLVLTDADGQGTLSMSAEQLREFREGPLNACASANRTQVPASNMKLRYAPYVEMGDGAGMEGATLVAIRPSNEGCGGGGGRREMEGFVGGAFGGGFRVAVRALLKRRTYLLEMNGF